MVTHDDNIVIEELVDRFIELGLTEYESRTLIALLQLGTGTAKDIAGIDGIPRTRVYDSIETLHDLGLVDIQYTTPRKFSVVSQETLVVKLRNDHLSTITEISELLDSLGPTERRKEQTGVWVVRGHDAVSQRLFSLLDSAEERVIYMTVDDLLTDAHLDHLRDAEERGADLYIAGISEEVQRRIDTQVPSAQRFDTLWDWEDTPAGSLLIVDDRHVLLSVRLDGVESGDVDETAIWGSGDTNSLVVVLREIFSWRLDTVDLIPDE